MFSLNPLASSASLGGSQRKLIISEQPREGTTPESDTVEDAGTSMDGGDEGQESQHRALPPTGLGLEGLRRLDPIAWSV